MSEQATKKHVVFVCTHNSCRSQMAEGFLRELAGDHIEAASAGTNPTRIEPRAVRVMAEAGVDIAGHWSKSIDEVKVEQFDYVITVCNRAREACPIFPGGATSLHWSFDDPAQATGSEAEQLDVFRRVRDEILASIKEFLSAHIAVIL